MARPLPVPPAPRDFKTRKLLDRLRAYADPERSTTVTLGAGAEVLRGQHEDLLVGLSNIYDLVFRLWQQTMVAAHADGIPAHEQATALGLSLPTVHSYLREGKKAAASDEAATGTAVLHEHRSHVELVEALLNYAGPRSMTVSQHEDRLIGLFNAYILVRQLWQREMMLAQDAGVSLGRQADLLHMKKATVQTHIRAARAATDTTASVATGS